ncbi:coiled-coil domain-containing protein 50 isoform X1 [Rhineura floridana]|uniref:coiled-coil domain-containing protein 50 isoform X1 n=1 Tax=Rhineura floridana TaxID=261503 RepID=UPI002AC85A63|nr:coiled-coil domain-containing protein 50 isoform X1 [Rhineura floridana]
MAEISIDQSKLPGVKEVCRDFAVLEDHTLAHSLQEQEIEHHLATNVQRNRLVQYDLQMAKQLQEEEDRKARTRIQERHKDIEWQDCEIAQEIQVKLVIEAEQRRRQEEDDEDIARILQQKELQEEKRRKKPPPEPLRHGAYEEGCYPESRHHSCGSPGEQASEHARPHRAKSGGREPRHPRDHQRAPPLVSEGLDLEVLGSSSEVRKGRDGQRQERERRARKLGGQETPPPKPSLDMEDNEPLDRGNDRSWEYRERKPASHERPWRPSSLVLDGEAEHPGGSSRKQRKGQPRSRERPQSPPPLFVDREDEGAHLDGGNRRRKHRERQSPGLEKPLRPPHLNADAEERRFDRRYGHSCSPCPDRRRLPPREDQQSPRPPSCDPRLCDTEAPSQRGLRRDGESEYEGVGDGARASPSLHHGEDWEPRTGRRKNPGMKSRGVKEAVYHKSRPVAAQDQEFYDAEIARKLQEEELLASQVDKRAAQVAQDEEIARLLLAEEKKAYKKAKEREKSSLEKKMQEHDWKHDTHELVPPRSREGHEGHRSRSDKPTRPPPPPSEDLDHLCNLTSQQNSAHQLSKPEPSQKGYHYKQ